MSFNGKPLETLIQKYKGERFLPAVFVINGDEINIKDQNDKTLTIKNLSFTQKQNGLSKIISKWIIKDKEGKQILMCIRNGNRVLYYYDVDIDTARKTFPTLDINSSIGFFSNKIDVEKEKTIASPGDETIFKKKEEEKDNWKEEEKPSTIEDLCKKLGYKKVEGGKRKTIKKKTKRVRKTIKKKTKSVRKTRKLKV